MFDTGCLEIYERILSFRKRKSGMEKCLLSLALPTKDKLLKH
jgi:hypothetical protein